MRPENRAQDEKTGGSEPPSDGQVDREFPTRHLPVSSVHVKSCSRRWLHRPGLGIDHVTTPSYPGNNWSERHYTSSLGIVFFFFFIKFKDFFPLRPLNDSVEMWIITMKVSLTMLNKHKKSLAKYGMKVLHFFHN